MSDLNGGCWWRVITGLITLFVMGGLWKIALLEWDQQMEAEFFSKMMTSSQWLFIFYFILWIANHPHTPFATFH